MRSGHLSAEPWAEFQECGVLSALTPAAASVHRNLRSRCFSSLSSRLLGPLQAPRPPSPEPTQAFTGCRVYFTPDVRLAPMSSPPTPRWGCRASAAFAEDGGWRRVVPVQGQWMSADVRSTEWTHGPPTPSPRGNRVLKEGLSSWCVPRQTHPASLRPHISWGRGWGDGFALSRHMHGPPRMWLPR